jgi:hypothetical protein
MEKLWDPLFILFTTCGIVSFCIVFVILHELPEVEHKLRKAEMFGRLRQLCIH